MQYLRCFWLQVRENLTLTSAIRTFIFSLIRILVIRGAQVHSVTQCFFLCSISFSVAVLCLLPHGHKMTTTAPNMVSSYIPNKVVRAALSLLSERKVSFPYSPITPSHSTPLLNLVRKKKVKAHHKTNQFRFLIHLLQLGERPISRSM